MNLSLNPILLAAMLAVCAFSSQAESGNTQEATNDAPSAPACPSMGHRHEHVKVHSERRANALKAALELAPEQEATWVTYMAAMKPPAGIKQPDRTQIAGLTTPERLDMIRELRQQREAWFTQRDTATRSFYASLRVEQQKVFDERLQHHFQHGVHERTRR